MTKDEFTLRAQDMRLTLYRVARAYGLRECDCADTVQEALFKAWQKLPSLRQEEYFGTWLVRILIRGCVDAARREKRETPTDTLPETPVCDAPPDPDLARALAALPEAMRIVVALYYAEGYAAKDIARALRLPKGTVCSRLSRARAMLKALLGEEFQ